MKDSVRLSFDVSIEEHIEYKTESVKCGMSIKNFLHNLVILGMKEYKKKQLRELLKKSVQQAKKGKVRTVTSEELDQWEQELEDESK